MPHDNRFGRMPTAATTSNEVVVTLHKKICMLGDAGVGKTSLIRRYVLDQFDDKYISTIGTKVSVKTVGVKLPLDNNNRAKNLPEHLLKITFSIWDIAGQATYKNIHTSHFKGAEGAIAVADITRPETVYSIHHWLYQYNKYAKRQFYIIAVNKIDLAARTVFSDDAENLARSYNTELVYTSAKTGEGVNDAFYKLAIKLAIDYEQQQLITKQQLYYKQQPYELAPEAAAQPPPTPTLPLPSATYQPLEYELKIEAGYSYLIKELGSRKTMDIFKNLIQERPTVCLTSTFPPKLQREYQLSNIDHIYWVTEISTYTKHINPKRIDFELTEIVIEYLKRNPQCIVFLDCLEQLILVNGLEPVINYLKTIIDSISYYNSALVVSMRPEVYEAKQAAKLEQLFDYIYELK